MKLPHPPCDDYDSMLHTRTPPNIPAAQSPSSHRQYSGHLAQYCDAKVQ